MGAARVSEGCLAAALGSIDTESTLHISVGVPVVNSEGLTTIGDFRRFRAATRNLSVSVWTCAWPTILRRSGSESDICWMCGAQCIELDGLDGWEDVRRHGACVVEDYRMTSGSGWLL